MADILQITEDIPVDDSIYEYEYKEYNPIVGTDLNRGSIVLTIEAQDIYMLQPICEISHFRKWLKHFSHFMKWLNQSAIS